MTDFNRENLEEMTCADLRDLCADMDITGVSKTRKDILVNLILEKQVEVDEFDPEEDDRIPYLNSSDHSYLKNGEYETMVSVSCGAASSNYPVVGRTVGYVKAVYREILNVEIDSISMVNGEEVTDSTILKSSDVLEFVRRAGTKG